MSAPLFIRTPYMLATQQNSAGAYPLAWETIASHASTETTTLLVEDVRFWFSPPASAGGNAAGSVKLAVLTPDSDLVLLDRYAVDALAQDAYAAPVRVQLDLQLPPGYALQLYHDIDDVTPGAPATCHVVAQGGELG